jgi:methionyl-tRNA synthetase
VSFPGAPDQVVYVWVDALVNYISGLGYADWKGDASFWGEDATKIHVIGKNVWKFHAVYWPALLLSAGLPLPNEIVVHGFLTSDGKKISKTAGNTTDPTDHVERYGSDAVRYYLLRHIRPFEDTDFSADRLREVYHTELANNLGNLLSRLTALAEAVGLKGVNPGTAGDHKPPSALEKAVLAYRFDEALNGLWEKFADLNREVAEAKPWEDLRAGRKDVPREQLRAWVVRLYLLGGWLRPFLPRASARIQAALSADRIRKTPPLFPRL